MEVSQMTQRVKVFFSYAHEDQELRKELEKHLSILKRNGIVSTWHDREIGPGREWKDVIDEELEKAHIVLLLISSSFLASDYCYDLEMKKALERHGQGSAVVIPIILRPVDWKGAPFGKLQALPVDARPVTKWGNRDEAFENIAKGIRSAAEQFVIKQERPETEDVSSEIIDSGESDQTSSEALKSAVSEAVEKRFVGRRDALDEFYQRFAYIHMQNVVYYWGGGGTGKTWILQKIYLDNQNDPTRATTRIIDFFDTQNQSIRGLQASIRERLEVPGAPEIFAPYATLIAHIEATRENQQAQQRGQLAFLENSANKVFIECCQKAVRDRTVILLFDTLERVQQRDVGQWLLQEFLAQVRDVIVAMAGRPAPAANPSPAKVPDNVVSYELEGLSFEDVQDYVQKSWPQLPVPDHLIQSIYDVASGNPLLLNLIFDLSSAGFIHNLDEIARIDSLETLKRNLIKEHFSEPNNFNRMIWAMAYLRRRFDISMLQHVVEHDEIFHLSPGEFDEIVTRLRAFRFVKEYPEQESHLLHDEMQGIIQKYLLEDADPRWDFRGELYELIVENYYSRLIDDAEDIGDFVLSKQLRAEQFGYTFERARRSKNLEEGLRQYQAHREQIEISRDYDFEELLWGEIRDQLPAGAGYEYAAERGRWLRNRGLFSKSEDHFHQMLDLYPGKEMEILKSLGFSQHRQGKFEQAIGTLLGGLNRVQKDNYEQIASYENLLGQAKHNSGRWDEALDHYRRSLRAFQRTGDLAGIAGVYINRSYIYSAQGLYATAIDEAQRALNLISSDVERSNETDRNRIFSQLNMGTAYRHSGNYEKAENWYKKSLKTARQAGNQEGCCQALENLGVNFCLRGKKAAREEKDFLHAAQLQLQALRHLTEALSIAGETEWQFALADGLSRLARVYEEIHYLVNSLQTTKKVTDLKLNIRDLEKDARNFHLPAGIKYTQDLFLQGDFSTFSWLEKAASLFEISYRIADDSENIHRALDSLMEFARLLIELERFEVVPSVISRTERIKGYDYQESLFSAMAGITQADLDFELENYSRALDRYSVSYPDLAKQSGYASYLLTNRLSSLEERLRRLSPEERIRWCDTLADSWSDQKVSTVRPDMLHLLERISSDALKDAGR
jgi:tetratricopeptide (TPR) repeat protein